jgi:WD40 repeat protein
MTLRFPRLCVVSTLYALTLPCVVAQTANPACGAAPVVAIDYKPNIFTLQQELWLGEASRDFTEAEHRPAQDTALNAHLQELADKLAKNLPEPHVPFHVVLVESSEVNGWSIAGGSIYITRKLAATAKSDDELAAVIGHEMGHIASHQFAFEATAGMQRLLHVNSAGDRKDVYAKFQQLIDAELNDKHPPKEEEEEETGQDEADRIGVYLTAAAGYRPQAASEFWDRSFFVGGKTGSRLGDFFGMTQPNQKRLRGMLKMAAALPAMCVPQVQVAGAQAAFEQWQRRVTEDRKTGAENHVEGATEVKLSPPLQMEVNRLRFSPDGKLVLAQDESSVYVLSREPWALKFRADADRADSAWFSPDSSRVTFTTPGLHTEEWSVADQKLIDAHEPLARHECVESKLSPDGRTIVCVSFDETEFEMNLYFLDSKSGEVLWQKKPFFKPTFGFALSEYMMGGAELPSDLLWSSFSGDGNYLLIGPGSDKIAFDLRTRTPIKLGDALKSQVTGPFAFLGSDRVAGENVESAKNSGIFSFPEGKRLEKLTFQMPDLQAVSNPGSNAYVLSTGITTVKTDNGTDSKIALADLSGGRYILSSKTSALDLWNQYFVSESFDGSILLATLTDGKVNDPKRLPLPNSPLGRLQAVAASPDGRYIAFSSKDRSGVWDMRTGVRYSLMFPFTNVVWTPDGSMYAEFPKTQRLERNVTEINLDKKSSRQLNVKLDDATHMRYGWLMEWKTIKHAAQLDMHRLNDNTVAWNKYFPEGEPHYTGSYGGRDLIFSYPVRSDAAKTALKGNSALAAELALVKNKDNGRVIEVVDASSGKTVGQMVLELPPDYEGVDGLNRAGDRVFVSGGDNRTLVYSLQTGKQVWQAFGYVVTVDADTGRSCIVNRRDEAIVYDADGKELKHIRSGEQVRYAAFGSKATTLTMLTADQVVRTIRLDDAALEAAK